MRPATSTSKSTRVRRSAIAALLGTTSLLLVGCQAVAITAAGIGASTGLAHTASSISYRTFTASEDQVRVATLMALRRMGIRPEATEKAKSSEVIRASVADRSIQVEIESLNESTTRISATAQRGVFIYDAATAREIVVQTEVAMSELAQNGRPRAASKMAPAVADSSMSPPAMQR